MPTSIRLAPETERRLGVLASRTGRTKAFYLRELIERGLDDMETTTLPPTYWSAFAGAERKYIPLTM